MHVTLLGASDTTGTPTVSCNYKTCLAARERGIGRTRFSVHMQNEWTDESLLVNFSPDFRHQFPTQGVSLPDEASVAHIYFDHLDGLGNIYRLLDGLSVHTVDEVDPVTGENVADTICSEFDYLDHISVEDQTPFESFHAYDLGVTFVSVVHPPLVCYGVAIKDPETGAKLSLSEDTTHAILEAPCNMLRDPDLLLAEAIVPVLVYEYYPISGDDYDEDEVTRTFGTKHMTRKEAIALDEELNTNETRLVYVAHYYPADEAFEESLAVDGKVYGL